MKRASKNILQGFISVMLLLISTTAAAGVDFCTSFPADQQRPIIITNKYQKSKVIDTLANYNTITEIRDGTEASKYLFTNGGYSAYCLIFQSTALLDPLVEKLSLSLADDHDVFIIGLDVTAANGNASFFEITNNSASKAVYLVNSKFHNVMTGITTLGSGRVEMHHVDVSGKDQSGPCISLKSPGAVLDDIEAKGCGVGIKVEANNATITSSGDVTANLDPATQISNNITNISQNKIGIHIMSGVTMTKITRSRIFACDDTVNDEGTADGDYVKKSDMIRMDGGSPTRLIFFDGQGEDIEPLDEDMTKVVDYSDRPVYINVPLAGTQNVAGNVTIDFYSPYDPSLDYEKPQAFNFIDTKIPVDVPASQLMNAPLTYQLPASSLNKNVVTVYNDPRYGTTALAQSFKVVGTGEIVIFVDSPFDQTSLDNQMRGVAEMGGGETVVAEAPTDAGASGGSGGGGGGGGSAVSARRFCTLIPDDATRAIPWPAALWWLLLLTTPAAALAVVRHRNRRSQ